MRKYVHFLYTCCSIIYLRFHLIGWLHVIEKQQLKKKRVLRDNIGETLLV